MILANLFSATFGKTMIVAIMGAVVINGYLCFQNKVKDQQLITAEHKLHTIQAHNEQLKAQLEHTQLQIEQYQVQVKNLHQNILEKVQQAEKRTHDIHIQLQQVKTWRDQPVPDNISRLFNERKTTISSSTPVSNGASLPISQNSH